MPKLSLKKGTTSNNKQKPITKFFTTNAITEKKATDVHKEVVNPTSINNSKRKVISPTEVPSLPKKVNNENGNEKRLKIGTGSPTKKINTILKDTSTNENQEIVSTAKVVSSQMSSGIKKRVPLSPIKNEQLRNNEEAKNKMTINLAANLFDDDIDCDMLSCDLNQTENYFTEITKSKHVVNEESPKMTEYEDIFVDDWDSITKEELEDLDLSSIQRCEVLSVIKEGYKTKLRLKNSEDKQGTCYLEGVWSTTPIVQGDIVSVIATRDHSGSFSVTNTDGLLVLRPDHLMSTTSVVGGVFCRRKAVLQERFKGIDCGNSAMTIGILIHELVQLALTNRIMDITKLRTETDELVNQSIQMLYDAGLTVEEARTNMEQYIQPLAEFMNTYVAKNTGNSKMPQKNKWPGHVDDILDIEENVCCAQLGLKGKIDATLLVTIHDKKDSKQSIVPLELKSGRASGSAEHRGQLVLYGMMCAALRGEHPARGEHKGLLLYLKERVDLREVTCGHPEKRDLLMLRNDLVQYLSESPNDIDAEKLTDMEEASQLLFQNLPEPIHHEMACAKCPYITLCSLHLWHTPGPLVSETHPLAKLKSAALGHLTLKHIKYFLHWSALLKMEERVQKTQSPLHSLWTEVPAKRKKKGLCASELKLKSVSKSGDRFAHIFERTDEDEAEGKHTKGPQEGDFSIVSIDKRPWIAAGIITCLKDREIHIQLERDLSRRYNKATMFHIDNYESYATTVHNLTNIGALMEDNDQANHLRRLIIDKESPEFEKKLSREVGRLGIKLMKSLNIQQQRAVLKALAAKDYALLQGLPGTGKTQTISVLIQMLVALKQRVLVTAHTHSAVDTVLSRLPPELKIMRLGSSTRVVPNLRSRCERVLTAHCKTPEELIQVYDSMEVIGVTCLGASHALLSRSILDVCIVDEAAQVSQCTALRAILSARLTVLVGDSRQLPPLVRSKAARRLGMEESLFHRLKDEESTCTLQLQYRMNETIARLANIVAYDGQLQCANEMVRTAVVDVDSELIKQKYKDHAWLLKACSPLLEDAAMFIDLCDVKLNSQLNKPCSNVDEACVVLALVEALVAGGVNDIGIIAPYREQVSLLRRSLTAKAFHSVEVSTVDQFQGKDKSVILFSCTRSGGEEEIVREGEVLNDQRRLAVSVTRAKHKLIIIGHSRAIKKYPPFQQVIDAFDIVPLSVTEHDIVAKKYLDCVS